MSNEPDTTQWSLPGPAEAPRDDLKLQLEVYGETILLRGFDGDTAWVRTVSADEIANVFTQHLGFSSGLLPQDAVWWNQGETGQVAAPLAAAAGLVRGPATGGVQAPRPAPAAHGRGWSSSARRGAPPGSTPRWAAQPTPSSISSGPPPSTSSATGGSAPEATGSRRRWD